MKRMLFLLILLPTLLGLVAPLTATAQGETVELVLHKRMFRDVAMPTDPAWYDNGGLPIDKHELSTADKFLLENSEGLNQANFSVYDATELYQEALMTDEDLDPKELVDKYSKMNRKEIQAVAAKLPLVEQDPYGRGKGKINTGYDQSLGEDGIGRISVPKMKDGNAAAYLIVEEELDPDKQLNVDLEKTSNPLLIILPVIDPTSQTELNTIHLYPKNVGYLRDPYFFKYGKTEEVVSEEALTGVEFVLFQYDDAGKKQYLQMDDDHDYENKWLTTEDPETIGITRFVSDERGLVNTGERFLPAGTYYFEEVKALPGYTIDSASRQIEVVIPANWSEKVTINGVEMEELVSGEVPPGVTAPKVYNTRTELPGTSSDITSGDLTTANSSDRGKLPQTGEAKMMISVAGFLLVGFVLLIYRRKQENQE